MRRLLLLLPVLAALGADWPTVLHDAARSGVTKERLAPKRSLVWSIAPQVAPARGWAEPEAGEVWSYGVERVGRVRYDDCYPVVAADGLAWYAASGEHRIVCVDAGTGAERWTFFTDAPPRLAPTYDQGRVYFGSDDGVVYCLNARTGKLLWKVRAAPSDRRCIGQGRLMSVWPVRTGVVVQDGVAYFAAGLFPSEGVYLGAVRAKDGTPVWGKTACQAVDSDSLSPQGYLLATEDMLIAPSGRISPTAFGRKDGSLLFAMDNGHGLNGGSYATVIGETLFNGSQALGAYHLVKKVKDKYGKAKRGRRAYDWNGAQRVVVSGGTAYIASDAELLAIPIAEMAEAAAQTQVLREAFWTNRHTINGVRKTQAELARLDSHSPRRARLEADLKSQKPKLDAYLAVEAKAEAAIEKLCTWRLKGAPCDSLILTGDILYAGGAGRVVGIDAGTGKEVWRGKVKGTVRELAAANGRLFASTTDGGIHCFAHGEPVSPHDTDWPAPKPSQEAKDRATRILRDTKITRGICVMLGVDEGLAVELARRTALTIVIAEPDAKRVASARRSLARTGLYGARITVVPGKAGERLLPPHCANLTIGVAGNAVDSVTVRTKVPGSGQWTHQYANPGNTGSSEDSLVRPPFGLQWFGDPGPRPMIDRHSRPPAPLVLDGRLFILGRDVVMARDAYNGTELWEREIPGAGREAMPLEASSVAASKDGLFVVAGEKCLRLDLKTGEAKGAFAVPPRADGAKRRWGWLAVKGGRVFGTRAESDRKFKGWPKPQFNTSECVFACDVESGALAWSYESNGIMHVSLAVGDDAVFLLDPNVPGVEPDPREGVDRKGNPLKRIMRRVVSLDAATGKEKWSKVLDVTDCVVGPEQRLVAGGEIALIVQKGVLLLCSAPWNGHFLKEFKAGKFSRRSIIALDAGTGKTLWSGHKGYRSRPIVVGDTIYAEPWAYDLTTGEPRTRKDPESGKDVKWEMWRGYGGCGGLAASKSALFFRTGALGCYDLVKDDRVQVLGGQRPGCWINFIPANGLLLMPEGSSGCICPFAIQCTVAYVPLPR